MNDSPASPFDPDDGAVPGAGHAAAYLVLVNGEGAVSLWPDFAVVPSGWRPVHGPDSHAGCLAHAESAGG
ncbi:MbtH family protein [Streptomyces hoynatensis]|uniref:MbtH family protein n=1 Tax=Streptomyces hoynatensis TaxID=1141874 RepID=UPI001F4E99A6|nr:MbtH family protein [Streptomyces hoynatensis]